MVDERAKAAVAADHIQEFLQKLQALMNEQIKLLQKTQASMDEEVNLLWSDMDKLTLNTEQMIDLVTKFASCSKDEESHPQIHQHRTSDSTADIGLLQENMELKNAEESNPQRQHHHHYSERNHNPKLDFPYFNGENPRGWLRRSEIYFDIYSVPDYQKVRIASAHLIALAGTWYRSLQIVEQPRDWTAFSVAVSHRFGDRSFAEVMKEFNSIQQGGSSVVEYQARFEELKALLILEEPDLRERYFVNCFLGGLRDDLKYRLISQKPNSLREAFEQACLEELAVTSIYKRQEPLIKAQFFSSGLFNRQTFKVYCKTKPSLYFTAREGKLHLDPADADNVSQLWYKDENYSKLVKDERGFPCFCLVNKATGQALKHRIGKSHIVGLVPYNPDALDESALWTHSGDFGDGFLAIRLVNNISLNFDAFNGNKKSGETEETVSCGRSFRTDCVENSPP